MLIGYLIWILWIFVGLFLAISGWIQSTDYQIIPAIFRILEFKSPDDAMIGIIVGIIMFIIGIVVIGSTIYNSRVR